ncbi:DUF4270 family protein [uncultured Polaribacter sp.]|uniref:DUF4270 family protein n=1 Tax=uncultured Polaribacter sp. TaxID=174711 RepID=UPI002634C3F0|nr:DUF4270 family protein [uncultured Polaribacter sp.]
MKNFFGKSAFVAALIFVFLVVISCEKDFTDINSGVISNTKFTTGQAVLDFEIKPVDIESIAADNIGLPINSISLAVEYWLGVYNKTNAKKITAGFVSQLGLPSSLRNSAEPSVTDTIYNLDKVVLKIPYTAVSLGVNTEGVTTYKLDSILGDTSVPTKLKVYRNPTFLNRLNPSDPSKLNSFTSNFDYKETELLTETNGFSFTPKATDRTFRFQRLDRTKDVNNTTDMVTDSIQSIAIDTVSVPFIAIPLNLTTMKEIFWDKFNDLEFSSLDEFQKHFKGIIVEAEGDNGALVPLNLTPNTNLTIDFLYSKTVVKEAQDNEVIKDVYSFPLGGIQNSIYKTEPINSSIPDNSFVIQGTAGISAEIKILGVNLSNLEEANLLLNYADKDVDNNNYLDLKELASIRDVDNNEFGFLINDADLTFGVNDALSTNSDIVPQRLYVYQNKENENGGITPTHLTDSYEEASFFNGNLMSSESNVPQSYTFKITDYISDLMDGSSEDFSSLTLKVYNPTDNPLITGSLNENVFQYNWNPRSVVLFNQNGSEKTQLKISFSKKKN